MGQQLWPCSGQEGSDWDAHSTWQTQRFHMGVDMAMHRQCVGECLCPTSMNGWQTQWIKGMPPGKSWPSPGGSQQWPCTEHTVGVEKTRNTDGQHGGVEGTAKTKGTLEICHVNELVDHRNGGTRLAVVIGRQRDHLALSAYGDSVESEQAAHFYQGKILYDENFKVANDESWTWDLAGDFVEARPNRRNSWHWLFFSPPQILPSAERF